MSALRTPAGFFQADEQLAQFPAGKAQHLGHGQAEAQAEQAVKHAGNEEAAEGVQIAEAQIDGQLAAGKGQQQQGGKAPDLMGEVAPEVQGE